MKFLECCKDHNNYTYNICLTIVNKNCIDLPLADAQNLFLAQPALFVGAYIYIYTTILKVLTLNIYIYIYTLHSYNMH